ncbi:DUF2637 domain-containing protein [Streptomyces sp. NPDC006368]|uniref:DUF2637 domain-containing protein n=1 Tax=Streptomyces sp. NPDC006368 TaxID=3156760 RepID=UPI0033AB01C3
MRERHAEEALGPGSGYYHQAGDGLWASAQDQTIPQGDFHGLGPSDSLPETVWDPAEELALLLQEAMQAEQVPSSARLPGAEGYAPDRDRLESLARITADLPPVRSVGNGHRKARPVTVSWERVVSFFTASLGALLVCVVSVLSGVIAYGPLLRIADPSAPADMVAWWPLLVYGPWVVASLSILRSAFHQRRAAHSWLVVLFFSLMAMLLCVAQADWSYTDVAAAALPTAASLACFHQLVRFITLTRPPRKAKRRHRISTRPPQQTTAASAPHPHIDPR